MIPAMVKFECAECEKDGSERDGLESKFVYVLPLTDWWNENGVGRTGNGTVAVSDSKL